MTARRSCSLWNNGKFETHKSDKSFHSLRCLRLSWYLPSEWSGFWKKAPSDNLTELQVSLNSLSCLNKCNVFQCFSSFSDRNFVHFVHVFRTQACWERVLRWAQLCKAGRIFRRLWTANCWQMVWGAPEALPLQVVRLAHETHRVWHSDTLKSLQICYALCHKVPYILPDFPVPIHLLKAVGIGKKAGQLPHFFTRSWRRFCWSLRRLQRRYDTNGKHIPWELTYPLPFGTFESMIFLFQRWDMLVPWMVLYWSG